jgi:hypothetical protein
MRAAHPWLGGIVGSPWAAAVSGYLALASARSDVSAHQIPPNARQSSGGWVGVCLCQRWVVVGVGAGALVFDLIHHKQQ